MTDIILALILIFVVLAWAEHSAWVADRLRVGRKWKAKFRKVCKNSWHRISKKLRIGKYRRTL